MDEFPIEASVDEFVDAVFKETGDGVICSACGHNNWATYDATPLTFSASNLRLPVEDDAAMFGFHAVAITCTRCGLVRFHAINVTFPPEEADDE